MATLARTRAQILAESRSDHGDWDVAFNEVFNAPPPFGRRRRARKARRHTRGSKDKDSDDEQHPLLRLAGRIATARTLDVPLDDILPEIALRQGLWVAYDGRLHPRRRVPTVPASLWSTPSAMVTAASVLARLDKALHNILFDAEPYVPRANLPVDILVATARYRAVLRSRGHFVGWAPLDTGVPASFVMTLRIIADAIAALPDWIYAHFRTYGPNTTFAATDGSRVLIQTDERYTAQDQWFSTANIVEPSVSAFHLERLDALNAKATATRVPIRYYDRAPSPLTPRSWRRREQLGTNYLTDSLARRHDKARDKKSMWNSIHRSVVERHWARSHFPTQALWEWELDGGAWDPKLDWVCSRRSHRVPIPDVHMFHGWWEQARSYRFNGVEDGEMDIDEREVLDWTEDHYDGDDEGPMDIDSHDNGSSSGEISDTTLDDDNDEEVIYDEPLPIDAPPPSPVPLPTHLSTSPPTRRLPPPMVIITPPPSDIFDSASPESSSSPSSPTTPSPPLTPPERAPHGWAGNDHSKPSGAMPDDPSLVPKLIHAASPLTHSDQGGGPVVISTPPILCTTTATPIGVSDLLPAPPTIATVAHDSSPRRRRKSSSRTLHRARSFVHTLFKQSQQSQPSQALSV